MSRAEQVPAKSRLLGGIALLLAVIVLPLALLTVAGSGLPPVMGKVVSLLLLPAAALAAWLLSRAEGGGWTGLGLSRPDSWVRSIALGIGAGVGMLLLSAVVILPIVVALFGSYIDPAALDPLEGNVGALLINVLLVSWLHAALCEEIIFRGYLLQRFEKVIGAGSVGVVVAVVLQAILFGLAHYPQGTTGMVATAVGGILWGALFLAVRRNLWVLIVAHAAFDTTVFGLVFLGHHRLVIPG